MSAQIELPRAFGKIVAEGIPGILKHQTPEGSIIYAPSAPVVYPQQAIFPLAFVWAGLDADAQYKGSRDVAACIGKLSGFLLQCLNDQGEFSYDSHGHKVQGVDQRLIGAWIEALRILRESGADFDYAAWGQKISAACENLIEHRLRRLEGVRRFLGRVMGTSTNHVALYCSTIYRAGQVLKKPALCEYILPLARALAADVHPDGYWDEHNDLLRTGGPTPSYNYLTHCGMALLAEWTGEAVFRAAIERSTRFHGNFCYPDASFCDVIDERVRYDPTPRVWGLFGFSHSPVGRGTALAHLKQWLALRKDAENAAPETLARMCENQLYWHAGETAPAPFENPGHRAQLAQPAGIFRKGSWCVAMSALKSTNSEDPVYRHNQFALDREKIFSVWHAKTGLLLDGSNAKFQPQNATFCADSTQRNSAGPDALPEDFYPMGGSVGEDNADWVVQAAYKTFYGSVRVRVLSETALQIELSADHAACNCAIAAGFTLRPIARTLQALSGAVHSLDGADFSKRGTEVGGGFRLGALTLKGPNEMQVAWPLSPFNCYAADYKSPPSANMLRVTVPLTPQANRARFELHITP